MEEIFPIGDVHTEKYVRQRVHTHPLTKTYVYTAESQHMSRRSFQRLHTHIHPQKELPTHTHRHTHAHTRARRDPTHNLIVAYHIYAKLLTRMMMSVKRVLFTHTYSHVYTQTHTLDTYLDCESICIPAAEFWDAALREHTGRDRECVCRQHIYTLTHRHTNTYLNAHIYSSDISTPTDIDAHTETHIDAHTSESESTRATPTSGDTHTQPYRHTHADKHMCVCGCQHLYANIYTVLKYGWVLESFGKLQQWGWRFAIFIAAGKCEHGAHTGTHIRELNIKNLLFLLFKRPPSHGTHEDVSFLRAASRIVAVSDVILSDAFSQEDTDRTCVEDWKRNISNPIMRCLEIRGLHGESISILPYSSRWTNRRVQKSELHFSDVEIESWLRCVRIFETVKRLRSESLSSVSSLTSKLVQNHMCTHTMSKDTHSFVCTSFAMPLFTLRFDLTKKILDENAC